MIGEYKAKLSTEGILMHVMVRRSRRLVLAALAALAVLAIRSVPANATAQVAVLTNEGIWIGSDTLLGTKKCYPNAAFLCEPATRSTACKLVLTNSRIIFNSGVFNGFSSFQQEEASLPLEDLETTMNKIFPLLAARYGGKPDEPRRTPNPMRWGLHSH